MLRLCATAYIYSKRMVYLMKGYYVFHIYDIVLKVVFVLDIIITNSRVIKGIFSERTASGSHM